MNEEKRAKRQAKKEEKKKYSEWNNLKYMVNSIFKKREYKIEKREVTKEDKKAALITLAIILGLGLLLWFLPFTHEFMEDFIFLRK